ncbi:MAG: Gfo/Idh/MocA family oxidoreductase [Kiritimatiellae bacterium]|nr:Gfo/Idh/MocA family oxidoreductase [Kiritimatiellia bacterium]
MDKATAKTAAKAAKAARPATRVAIIGMGIQSRTMLLPQFLAEKGAVVATICDCDKTRREYGAKVANDHYAANGRRGDARCKAEADFRKVLRDKSIDAVVIVTPDHWHAYMAVEAMKAGKDVYCEKPLTYSIDEAKLLVAAQRRTKAVFQTGAWQRSRREFRTAAMIVRNGLIGTVKHIDCNYGNASAQDNKDILDFHANLGGPSHPHRFFCQWDDTARKVQDVATESAPNPDVDWDMWLGPAPWSPYSDQVAPRGVNKFYPMFWRFDDNYGTGYNGDWGAHHLDIAQWAMGWDKTGPVKVVRSDAPYSTNPLHGGRRQSGMSFVFADGAVVHHNPFSTWGTVFYGSKGIVAVNRGKIAVWKGRGVKPTAAIRQALADDAFDGMKKVAAFYGQDWGKDTNVQAGAGLGEALDALDKAFKLDKAPVQLYKSDSQVRNFLECCRTRREPISPVEAGARAAILCGLCNISYVYDCGFDWDPRRNAFANKTGDPAWLRRPVYRNGWEPRL